MALSPPILLWRRYIRPPGVVGVPPAPRARWDAARWDEPDANWWSVTGGDDGENT